MNFAEKLPDACPPPEASETKFNPAYRIVRANPPNQGCFASNTKLGQHQPAGVDPCRFASCSLFTDIQKAKNIARLPKFRNSEPKIAKLLLPATAGVSILNKETKHIDLWFYEGFDPLSAIVTLEEVADG